MATSSGNHASDFQHSHVESKQVKKRESVAAGAVFLTLTTVVSAVLGFTGALALTKKQDPSSYEKGSLDHAKGKQVTGHALAAKAFRWGTLLAFSGVGLISFGVWKMLGVHNMEEFTAAVQSKMPIIPKKDESEQGRSDFATLKELADYLVQQDEIKKKRKEESDRLKEITTSQDDTISGGKS
ncbi:transmembrane protein 242-like [Ylistrum balloti]|uniref:transmembrane protein 242-like n=1 Tax=Ylistrum balloti TaxID=509963 RepID=UPI002905DDE5|nr:transmembrane protein 242-like [Ylistrum balloti]